MAIPFQLWIALLKKKAISSLEWILSPHCHWWVFFFSNLLLSPWCLWICSLWVANVGGSAASGEMPDDANEEEEIDEANKSTEDGKVPHYDDHLTPAEKRYIEQKERIDVHRLAKKANKSHRDRIQDFNQYLANMSEHYDIPKVGPGWSIPSLSWISWSLWIACLLICQAKWRCWTELCYC